MNLPPVPTMNKQCEDCHTEFIGSRFDNRCRYCERTLQLRRIADAIEYYVGLQ